MSTEVVMPQMGESIAEGTITKWLKKVGERVERDEPLFEISTDKVDAEIPSPAAGTLTEVRFKEGDTVEVNTVVAVLDGDQSSAARRAPAAKPAEETPQALKLRAAATTADRRAAEEPAAPPPPAATPHLRHRRLSRNQHHRRRRSCAENRMAHRDCRRAAPDEIESAGPKDRARARSRHFKTRRYWSKWSRY